jgi:hypothetical protein
MTRARWILLFTTSLLVVIAVWLWWGKPKIVDMAAYAPADSILYLEANRPSDVVEAVTGTDAWKAYERVMGTRQNRSTSGWLRGFVRFTGIGPAQSVILSRAQLAVVVTDLGTTESGDTLKVTAEAAILIETHTSESRIRPPFEEILKTLAEKTYGRPTLRRVNIGGVEFIEWIAPETSRQIVGALAGSLAIIGTSEKVVQECLAVSQGQRPSLKDDSELKRLRAQLAADRALSFGYVPSGQSARLLAVGIPLLLGRAPDSNFQRLITTGAAKVFGSLGWSSKPYLTGIEDRYLITLQPDSVAHLKPSFRFASVPSEVEHVVPKDTYSVTSYRFADPAAAWLSLKTAVSSQVDALSTVIFSSLLKSSLLSYGIDEPEIFLKAVAGELLTLRLDENAENSLLIAGVSDRGALRQMLTRKMSVKPGSQVEPESEIFEDSTGEFAASLSQNFVVLGAPVELRRYLAAGGTSGNRLDAERLKRMRFFATLGSASVVTYTNDASRVRRFFATLISTRGEPAPPSTNIDSGLSGLPYSVTETALGDNGIERTTRSPLGQFSALLPLLIPEQPSPIK